MTTEAGIDLMGHNSLFYGIINDLCVLKFGEEIHELIIFYIYESKSPDGSVKAQLKDGEGRFIKLETPEDLWNLIVKINPNIDPK